MQFKHLAFRGTFDAADLLKALRSNSAVERFLSGHPKLRSDIDAEHHPVLTPEHKIVLLNVILADQGNIVFAGWEEFGKSNDQKKSLADYLISLEKFYGIVNYNRSGIMAIDINTGKIKITAINQEIKPTQLLRSYNLSPQQRLELKRAVFRALDAHEQTGQAWVIGGAADRLNFKDSEGYPLPQGEYPIDVNGRTLFALYFDDLLALTTLHYHITGRTFKQPVAAMTSEANDARIKSTFTGHDFYGYGRAHIMTAAQILVPVIGKDYKWCMKSGNPYKILTKAHGHGDYYQMMKTSGIFALLEKAGIEVMLMRQVNNPLAHRAGIEAVGILLDRNKEMVFLTIPRRATAPEGSLVMVKERTPWGKYKYQVYNIEYSELKAAGIIDAPVPGTAQLSPYGGNLNAFAFRIASILRELSRDPFPGELINLKKPIFTVRDGSSVSVIADRLEAQMQGAAKLFSIESDRELTAEELAGLLPVVTFDGEREEIFYVAKAEPDIRNGDINDTPLTARKALIDRRTAWLLEAGMSVPHRDKITIPGTPYPETTGDTIIFLSTIFAFNPEILKGKIEGGYIGRNSYLDIDGEHVRVENLRLDGSLIIRPENRIGRKEPDGEETPDPEMAGKVSLNNVTIKNKGRRKKWVKISIPPLGMQISPSDFQRIIMRAEKSGTTPNLANIPIDPKAAEAQRLKLKSLIAGGEFGENDQYLRIYKFEAASGDTQQQNQGWGYAMAWIGEYEEEKEEVVIEVKGNGEFVAVNVTLTGNHHFIVPEGHRITVLPSDDGTGYKIIDEEISGPSWFYSVSADRDPNSPQVFNVRRVLVSKP